MIGTRVAAVAGGLAVVAAGALIAAQPASASSGTICKTTANTGTCINIEGNGLDTQTVTASHYDHQSTRTKGGHFYLTGPYGYSERSPYRTYDGADHLAYVYAVGHNLPAGTYCVQFYLGTGDTPQTDKACAEVHS